MKNSISRGQRSSAAAIIAGALVAAACHNSITDTVLAVQLPGIIAPASAATVSGAVALATGARSRLRSMTAGSLPGGTESSWLFGGLLGDEWTTSSTFIQNDEADERRISSLDSTLENAA